MSVSLEGKCTFETYINNLDSDKSKDLVTSLEELLGYCLPYLEMSWGHGSAVTPPDEDDEDNFDDDPSIGDPEVIEEKSLRGRKIQVITKIVDYEVPPGG